MKAFIASSTSTKPGAPVARASIALGCISLAVLECECVCFA